MKRTVDQGNRSALMKTVSTDETETALKKQDTPMSSLLAWQDLASRTKQLQHHALSVPFQFHQC
jgi:hypothetical protein